jgi:hypothetical protein
MAQWETETLKLKENHGWKAKPGYKIFVADRGAIRFDLPKEWVIVPGPKSIQFYDRQPPDDNCRLEVSLIRHPPIDWSGLPLPQLIREVVKDGPRNTPNIGDVHTLGRPDLELVWTELSSIDATQHRDACSRICLARSPNTHAVITLDFWKDDAGRLGPVWEALLASLELGLSIQDPTRGPVPM